MGTHCESDVHARPTGTGVTGVSQVPKRHVAPPLQRIPQLPQLFGSLSVLMHSPPQKSEPKPHAQVLARQKPRAPQLLPQLPQFAESSVVSTQAPSQRVRLPQSVRQVLMPHSSPAAHALPQLPQLAALLRVSTQAVPQRVRGVVQVTTHDPASQV